MIQFLHCSIILYNFIAIFVGTTVKRQVLDFSVGRLEDIWTPDKWASPCSIPIPIPRSQTTRWQLKFHANSPVRVTIWFSGFRWPHVSQGLIAGREAERDERMQFVESGGFRLIDIDSGRGTKNWELRTRNGEGEKVRWPAKVISGGEIRAPGGGESGLKRALQLRSALK